MDRVELLSLPAAAAAAAGDAKGLLPPPLLLLREVTLSVPLLPVPLLPVFAKGFLCVGYAGGGASRFAKGFVDICVRSHSRLLMERSE